MRKRIKTQGRRAISLLLTVVMVFGLFSGVLPTLSVAAGGDAEGTEYLGLKIAATGANSGSNRHIHVKLLDFGATADQKAGKQGLDGVDEGPESGSYEVTFTTPEVLPGNLGFLARFKDESGFVGVSYDGGSTNNPDWKEHNSKNSTSRTNNTKATNENTLQPNHTYTLKMEYDKEGMTVSLKDEEAESAGFVKVAEKWQYDSSSNYTEGNGGFAVRFNATGETNNYIILKKVVQTRADGTSKTIDYQNDITDVNNIPYVVYKNNTQNTPGEATLELVAKQQQPSQDGKAPEKPEDDGSTVEGLPFDENLADYRIPALTTGNNGRLIAASDNRWNGVGHDGGAHDLMVSVSDDNGAHWKYHYVGYFNDTVDQFNLYGASINGAALAADGKSDTIYLLAEAMPGYSWPSGEATFPSESNPQEKVSNTKGGSGFVTVDGSGNAATTGTRRLALYTSPKGAEQNDWQYYVGEFEDEDGKKLAPVYAKGTTSGPEYYVDDGYYLYDAGKAPVYCKQITSGESTNNLDVHANVFYWNAEVHVKSTCFLLLYTSTDNGDTWSAPQMLDLATDEEFVYVTGPGRGIVTADGDVVFTGYNLVSTATNEEHASLIYLKKDTNEWKRSADISANTGESVVTEVDGKLMVFARTNSNTSGDKSDGTAYVYYADSLDAVATESTGWHTGSALPEILHSNQLSAITYSQKYKGKSVVFLSAPHHPGTINNTRGKGRIWAGLVDPDTNAIDWVNEFEINNFQKGFAYSCLTETGKTGPDGKPMVAILYERNNEVEGVTLGQYYFNTYSFSDLLNVDDTTGPWKDGSATHASGTDTNAFSNVTDVFNSTVIGKWANIPIWTLDSVESFEDGIVSLTYVDNGVDEDGGTKRQSDFGVFLNFAGNGSSAADRFLYIGYTGSTTASSGSSVKQGWFWQYRYGNAGEYLASPLTAPEGTLPEIGQETTITVTIHRGTISVAVNGVVLDDQEGWDVTGGNKKGSLSELLTNVPSGKVGFGMVTSGTDASCSANVTVQDFHVEEITEVDVTELEVMVGLTEVFVEDDYTAYSWAELQEALDAANTILERYEKDANHDGLTQQEIDDAAEALLTAIDGLVLLSEAVDPGLPEADPSEIETPDDYEQNMVNATGSLGNNPVVNVNQEYWGMDGNALLLGSTNTDDPHIEFLELANGTKDGLYEFTIRTGATAPTGSVGFLARYKDEQHYAGFSIDSGNVVGHAATGTGRQNTQAIYPFPWAPLTTYMMYLKYEGTTLTLGVKLEGDEDYETYEYTLDSAATTEAGGFAVRLRGGYEMQFDNIKQYSDVNGEHLIKELNFNDLTEVDASKYVSHQNKAYETVHDCKASLVEIPESQNVPTFPAGKANMLTGMDGTPVIDTASPKTHGMIYTARVYGDWTKNLGLVFNYQDKDNYATVTWKDGHWVLGGKSEGNNVSEIVMTQVGAWAEGITDPTGSEARTLRIDMSGETVKLYVSAGSKGGMPQYATYTAENADGLFSGDGKVGVIGMGDMFVGPIQVIYNLMPVEWTPAEGKYETIASDDLTVYVGKDAPFVYKYVSTDGTEVAYGTLNDVTAFGVALNGDTASVSETKMTLKTGNSATYTFHAIAGSVAADFEVRLAVKGKVLTLTVLRVTETAGTVRTFQFTDPMLSFAGLGAEAALGHVKGWGPASDSFVPTKGQAENQNYQNMTYALLSDRASKTVAAMENNGESTDNKWQMQLRVNNTGAIDSPYVALVNTAWAWQYYANSNPDALKDSESAMYYDRLPYAKVVIGGDENKDKEITWQDAGVAYRTIMIKAYGSENTKNEWMFIAMNMSSQASQPFLRVLDLAKSISYMTDGFGFKIMNKGYQAGGHDDSHGDYKFVGIQQGGADDFNTLINVGLQYGIKNGVHMNVTEFALDSAAADTLNRFTKNNGGGLNANWKWFDQAYWVDKSYDVSSGDLLRRITSAFGNDGKLGLNGVMPKLDFAYVDVYQSGSGYNATQLVKYLNEAGITVGTEALGDFDQGITFVHWNTDMYYAVGGTQSEVMRFVVQGLGDLNAPDKALLGAMMPSTADWRNTNNPAEAIQVFYRDNLPTKFLQHYELLSWTPDTSATFSGGVTTEVEDGYTLIKLNDKLVAKIDTSNWRSYSDYSDKPSPQQPNGASVFIPWSPETQDKIYFYNDLSDGVTTWQLPDTWKGVTTVYAYKLTSTGRTGLVTLTASGDSINLSSLDRATPYILVQKEGTTVKMYDENGKLNGKTLPELKDHPYGEGTGIADPGFTSGSLGAWKAEGENANGLSIVSGTLTGTNGQGNGQGNGDPRVSIPANFDGSLSQEIQVEAGKTYTFSAWVYSPSGRSVTLKAISGDKVLKETTLDGTVVSGYSVAFRPTKFFGTGWQRMRLEGVTVPAGTVTLSLEIESGSNIAYVDDFRSWQYTGSVNQKTFRYYYYEDFENLDENWGPFVSLTQSQPLSHLAYKFDDENQIKTFVIDGNTSLKGQESAGRNAQGQETGLGPKMRTIPSTLSFNVGDTYTLEFDYQTYRELKANEDGHLAGQNVPLKAATYAMVIHNVSGSGDITVNLEPSALADGEEIGYSAKFKTATGKATFTATADTYITLNRITIEGEATAVYVLDNFRVQKADAPTTTQITVDKVWQDSFGKPIDAPEGASVTVALVKDGVKTDKTATLNAANGWKHTFTDLDITGTYTVEETPVDGYVVSYTDITADSDGEYLTVINSVIPQEFDVTTQLTHGASNAASKAIEGKDFTFALTPENGYNLPDSITVTVNGETLAADAYRYDPTTGRVTIPGAKVTGPITVTATFTKMPVVTPDEPGEVHVDVYVTNGAPVVTLPDQDALADVVLTEEDRDQLTLGNDVDIVLTVTDITKTVSSEEKKLIGDALGKYTLGRYMDLALTKRVNGKTTDIEKTDKAVTVVITIPEALKGDKREYAVIRIRDGKAELVKDLDTNANTITIETDVFSTYAIVYKAVATPPTGDQTPLFLLVTVMVLSAAAIVTLVSRKRKVC